MKIIKRINLFYNTRNPDVNKCILFIFKFLHAFLNNASDCMQISFGLRSIIIIRAVKKLKQNIQNLIQSSRLWQNSYGVYAISFDSVFPIKIDSSKSPAGTMLSSLSLWFIFILNLTLVFDTIKIWTVIPSVFCIQIILRSTFNSNYL